VEIAIGVFDSTERAEQAVKDLRENQIPGQAIIFLTGSKNEAMTFTEEIGAYVGAVMGGAVQFTAGQIGSALAMVPGFGQVYAIGLGAAALLHYWGSKVGASAVQRSLEASRFKLTAPEQSAIDSAFFIDVLKHGRSIVIVQTKFHDVAAEATAILDRLGLGKQTHAVTVAVPALKGESSTRQVEGVTIVDLRGKIDFVASSKEFRDILADLGNRGIKSVLLNMKEVDFVDSSGIGEMVRGHVQLSKIGGQLKLVNLSKHVTMLLQVTSLNKVFEIFDNEANGIKSFASGPTAKSSEIKTLRVIGQL
jgi:anti-sigma B factor antagonist